MSTPLVLTIVGPDRTGLVEAVARVVAEHGGNWLESRMCRLGGEFAGLLRIAVPAAKQGALIAALQTLADLNIVIHAAQPTPAVTTGRQTTLEIVGSDRPGIVRDITSALARAHVNVEEFASEVVSAPMSGETLFKASARLQLPDRCDLAALKQDLEQIAADLQVDVVFAELG